MAIAWSDVEGSRTMDRTEGTLLAEIGQSFYLMGLLAAVSGAFVGLGLLAVRLLG